MALFLANHSPAKIMILGCWKLDAFLMYIQPQVLEWTHSMSGDMICNPNFVDATFNRAGATNPILCSVHSKSFNGHDSVVVFPSYNIHH